MKIWMIVSAALTALIGGVYALEGLNTNNLDVKALALLLFGVVNITLVMVKKSF